MCACASTFTRLASHVQCTVHVDLNRVGCLRTCSVAELEKSHLDRAGSCCSKKPVPR